jgi:sugar diacid utilization regulator
MNNKINPNIRYSPAVCIINDNLSNKKKYDKLSIYNTVLMHIFETLNSKYGIHASIDDEMILHFLIPIPDTCIHANDRISYTRKIGRKIQTMLKDTFKFTSNVIIGSSTDQWNQVRINHNELLSLPYNILAASPLDSIIHIHDIGASRLLAQPTLTDSINRFYLEYFAPLQELPKENIGVILDTVSNYIESNFNYRETARIMNVHHNTVRNRLETFSVTTGLEIGRAHV